MRKMERMRALDEVIAEIPLGYFHYRLLLLCGLSFIADGMEISLIFFISTCAGREWELSDNQMASIASAVFAGMLIGNFVWGYLADMYGRRTIFITGGLVITMAGFLSGFSPNYLSLLLLRGAVGFGLGSSSVPFDLLAEFLPASRRGSFLIYIEYFWTVGSVMVAGSAWLLLSRFSWRVLTYITAIPVSLACLGSIPLLPESPRWLLTQGRAEEAERIILSAVKMNGAKISAGIGLSKPIVDDMESRGSIMDLCSVKTLRVSIPLCILWCSFGMAYYATILFNGDVSQHDDDVNDDNDGHDSACSFDYASTFYSALSEVIGCSIVAVIIERWGRVRSQTVLYTAAAMGAIGMGLSVSWPGKAVFTGMSVLARLGVFSASAATWVHTPELFRTEVRATGHACANAMSQLGSSAGPFIVYRLGNVQIGLLIAALNITCVICALCLPETVGVDLDKIIRPPHVSDIIPRVRSTCSDGYRDDDQYHSLLAADESLNTDDRKD